MSTKHLLICAGIVYWFATAFGLRADVLVMQNGDRYSGKVLAVSADTVVLNSEILGKINVPRRKVANLAFGTNAAAPQATAVLAPAAVNAPAAAAPPALVLAGTNLDLSAALRQLGANTNFIGQIRQQMFAGNPQAAGRFDEMVNG
jgi:heme/copper-type cytochrome/quinol oxidase subunit 1